MCSYIKQRGREMKNLWIMLFVTTMAWGQVERLDIKNLNFTYRVPLGEGSADSFSYQVKSSQRVIVEKIGEDFKFAFSGVENREFLFENAPLVMKNAEEMRVNKFNINLDNSLSISTELASFISPDASLDLNSLSLRCNRLGAAGELSMELLLGCIDKMSFTLKSFDSMNSFALEKAIARVLTRRGSKQGLGLRNVGLTVNKGKLDLRGEVKAQLSGRVSALGNISYDSSNQKLVFQINSIKFGILDITARVFDELKKEENDNLKVNRPFIFISVK
jgi:hypothetical protein